MNVRKHLPEHESLVRVIREKNAENPFLRGRRRVSGPVPKALANFRASGENVTTFSAERKSGTNNKSAFASGRFYTGKYSEFRFHFRICRKTGNGIGGKNERFALTEGSSEHVKMPVQTEAFS